MRRNEIRLVTKYFQSQTITSTSNCRLTISWFVLLLLCKENDEEKKQQVVAQNILRNSPTGLDNWVVDNNHHSRARYLRSDSCRASLITDNCTRLLILCFLLFVQNMWCKLALAYVSFVGNWEGYFKIRSLTYGTAKLPLSSAWRMSVITQSTAVSVEWLTRYADR